MEGGIDEELLRPLLADVFSSLSGRSRSGTLFVVFPFPPNGYGEIPKNLQVLVRLYEENGDEWQRLDCDHFVIVHDSRKTEGVQAEIRQALRAASSFPAVYGLAIQEVEAWVLGDIHQVNRRVFQISPAPRLPVAPERDSDPKRTLTELFVRPSRNIESDRWNRECAQKVAPHLRHQQVAFHCPKGFGKLSKKLSAKGRTN